MIYSSFGIEPNFRYIEAIQFVELANYANYGLLYGCGLYIFSFLLSLYTNEFNKINFKLKNWHMVEAFCFYVFMTLAAPSLFELVWGISRKTNNKNADLLKANLKKKLEKKLELVFLEES